MVDSSSQQLGERAGEEWRLVENGGKGRPQGQEALLAADPTRPEEGGLVAGEQGKALDVSNGQLGGVEVTSASDPQLFLGGSHSVRGSYLEILLLLEREWTVRP